MKDKIQQVFVQNQNDESHYAIHHFISLPDSSCVNLTSLHHIASLLACGFKEATGKEVKEVELSYLGTEGRCVTVH
jgi:hypothetical protein